MRIAFDNVNFESFTGPNQMAFKLGTELQHNFDCEIVNANESEYDIVLVFIEQNKLAHNGVPIIQRLDGIWFKPEDFEIKNKQIRKTYDSVNAHIFQSEFDKQMIQKHFGKRDVPNIVIRNGTYAKNMFHKIKETSELEWLLNIRNDFDKIFIASSQWKDRPHKRLNETILFVYEYSKWSKDEKCCLITLGVSDKYKPMTETKHSENFTHLHMGNIMPSQTHIIYSIADWFAHLAYLDHCPNVVVDALACCVPVICSSEGGTAELIKNRGIIIKEDKFDFELCDYTKPPEIIVDKDIFRQVKIGKVISSRSTLDVQINTVAKQYYDFIQSTVNQQQNM